MLYDLECDCGEVSEHMMLMDETEKWVECPHCGGQICRRHHRVYTPPMIQGDTVAGGCNFSNYYDDGLGEFVKGRAHRKDLMKENGLVEYAPDPEMQKHRDNARNIRKNSVPSDMQAQAAIRNEYETADNKRRTKIVDKRLKESFDNIGL